MATEIEDLKLSGEENQTRFRHSVEEKESDVQQIREQLDQKSKTCTSAEVSLIHMNKTLDDLKSNFNGAKEHAEMVMGENDQFRADIRGLNGNLEVYSKQI